VLYPFGVAPAEALDVDSRGIACGRAESPKSARMTAKICRPGKLEQELVDPKPLCWMSFTGLV